MKIILLALTLSLSACAMPVAPKYSTVVEDDTAEVMIGLRRDFFLEGCMSAALTYNKTNGEEVCHSLYLERMSE